MTEVVARIVELFDSTCIKQFESMHCGICSLDEANFTPEEDSICASIACHSNDIELELMISATKGFLVKTMPLVGGLQLESESFQKDWCLELANRFLGRLKNKLLPHGCSLTMGLPNLVGCYSEPSGIINADFLVSRVFQVCDSGADNVIECSLAMHLLNEKLTLEDYEDEDEDWFDESELEHL